MLFSTTNERATSFVADAPVACVSSLGLLPSAAAPVPAARDTQALTSDDCYFFLFWEFPILVQLTGVTGQNEHFGGYLSMNSVYEQKYTYSSLLIFGLIASAKLLKLLAIPSGVGVYSLSNLPNILPNICLFLSLYVF